MPYDVMNKKSTETPGPATKVVGRMYANRVALCEDTKTRVVEVMEECLAEATNLYSQSKFAYWNVKGYNLYQLHLRFDRVAEVIEKQIDPIAERITQLGGVPNRTIRQAASVSKIPGYPVEPAAGIEQVRALAEAVACYCQALWKVSDKSEEIGDRPTSDFLNQSIVDAEEQLYFGSLIWKRATSSEVAASGVAQ